MQGGLLMVLDCCYQVIKKGLQVSQGDDLRWFVLDMTLCYQGVVLLFQGTGLFCDCLIGRLV